MQNNFEQNTETNRSTVELDMQPMNGLPSFQDSGDPHPFDEILFNPYFADFGFPADTTSTLCHTEPAHETNFSSQGVLSIPQVSC